ncbi:MAG: hypothetical protein ACLQVD_04525 [Capsulimonadaceae bacterium]
MVWLFFGLLMLAAVATFVLIVRSKDTESRFKALRRLADIKGWHFSRPSESAEAFGLAGETMVRGADGASFEWRAEWHLHSTRELGKDLTVYRCVEVPLRNGWIFVEPKSEAAKTARSRPSEAGVAAPAPRAAWKAARLTAKEVPVGSPAFLQKYTVSSTTREGLVRRIINQRVQSAMMAMSESHKATIRVGTEGIFVNTTAVFSIPEVEKVLTLAEMLLANAAQEQPTEAGV